MFITSRYIVLAVFLQPGAQSKGHNITSRLSMDCFLKVVFFRDHLS